MNKIFKVIWNPATGNFTVASETAKGRGKKSGRRKLLVSALVAGGLMSSFGASASVSLDGGTYSDGTELTDAWIAIGKGAKASSVGGSTASISIGVNAISAVGATAVGYDSHATGQSSVSMGQLSTAAGSRGVAIGSGASAAGDYTVALAVGSSASGESAVAIGQGSAAQKKGSVALGHKASSSGEKSVALGASSKATGDDSLALGRNALGNGTGSIAMGAESEANGLYSLAFGANSIADADNTVALGYGASATKAGAMVFGQAGKADGLNSIALGNKSQASSENSIAIGQESYSGSEKSIAIGSLSNVTGVNSVALGTESTAAEDNTVSVGNDTLQRKIVHMAKGDISSTSTDAINGSQLYDISKSVADRLGGGASVSTAGVVNAPNYKLQSGNFNNVGDALKGIDDNTLQWDSLKKVYSAEHGSDATSKITNVTAGTISSTSTDAVNGGQLFSLSDSLADYFGGNASVDENGVFTGPSYTIGSNSYDSVGDALAAINTSFSTSLGDALLWDETASAFSAGHGGNASKITNVANGAISETSTDAINGGQLYGVSNSVVDALGGNATVNADGSISAPTYSIANTDYNNVGDALDAIDSTLDDALLWDATAGENGAFSASRDGKASVITNVANGDISETSTDAINGSQLFATNTLINQQNEIINQIAGNTSETYIEENGAGLNYVRTNDTGLTFIDASASGTGATAVGYNAAASGESSVAIGQNSSSTVDTGIALGSSSVSSRVIAKSSRETSVTEDGVVIGYDTTDGELLGALSIGDDGKYRQIINVADGTEAHDAVTVRQLQNAIGAVTTTPTKYYHANSTEEDSLAVGTDSLAMGAKTIVNADAGIGIGLNTLVMADAINGIAIGSNARAYHANSIAMGNGSQTTRGAQTDYTAYNMDTPQNSVGEFSVGSEDGQRQITNVAAGSADTDAVNVSQLKVTDSRVAANTESINNLNTQVSSLDTRVTNIENGIGDIVTTGSTKYFKTNTDGADANAQGADSVAIGSGSIAAAENSVALGTNSVADEANTVSVGSSTQQRRITNVAAGVNNTDAVNVAQLKASEAGSVRYETNADGSVNYSVLNLGDGSGGTTRIGNVSAAVNDTDAVNYAQLKRSVEEANTYTDQKMGEMNSKIKGVENKMSGGIASAMAMAGLPQAYAPGANMTSIAGGTFNGESAVAIGVSMVSESGGWVYKLQGTSNSQGDYSAAIGAGFQW